MQKRRYDKYNGKDIFLYTIKRGGIAVDICEIGARINALKVNGVDIVLGFNTVKDYIESGCYAGATIGRVANRIAYGRFTLGNREYRLNTNDGKNHLHGGVDGFDKKIFVVTDLAENSVTMEYLSVDGEENYPGNLKLTVRFVIEDNALKIEFTAVSDKDTLWCPTNHAYFNLNGEGNGDCRDNLLQINADGYTPIGSGPIPTGEIRAVKNTLFDFTTAKEIGSDFGKNELEQTAGYDHNFVLNGEHTAHAESAVTDIKMDVYTDMPCVQFYTGGMLNNIDGKSGKYNKWAGFCLEPQYCPNAINMINFAKPILKKDDVKSHYIMFYFN